MKTVFVKFLQLLMFMLIVLPAFGQYNKHWSIGDSTMIEFTASGPIVRVFPIDTPHIEAGTTISDNFGNLLFCVTPDSIIDYDGNNIDNLSWPKPNLPSSTTQGILPIRLYKDTFGILSFNGGHDCNGTYTGTSCIKINKVFAKKDQGVISIGPWREFGRIKDGMTEKSTSIRHANGSDCWVILHAWKSSYFEIFLVKQSGEVTHTSQAIGPVLDWGVGQMMPSQDGSQIAFADKSTLDNGLVCLFDFDRCTGKLSNPHTQVLKTNKAAYGLCFSPNGEWIYYSSFDSLFQIPVNEWKRGAFSESFVGWAGLYKQFGQHQIGPDGKVYLAKFSTLRDGKIEYLSLINHPDSQGIACDYRISGLRVHPMAENHHLPHLPNFDLGPLPLPPALAGHDRSLACGGMTTLGDSALPNLIYSWEPSTNLSDPNIAQPLLDIESLTPGETRSYVLTVVDTSRSCRNVNQDTVTITREEALPPASADAGPDMAICEGAGLFLGTAAQPGLAYRWEGLGLARDDVAQPWARPFVPGSYTLEVTDLDNPCRPKGYDTVAVTFREPPQRADAGPDIALCDNLPLDDVIGAEAQGGLVYSWSPTQGLSNPNIAQPLVTQPGNYALTVIEDTFCISHDTVTVSSWGQLADAGPDLSLCENQPYTDSLGTAIIPGLIYYWSPASGLSASDQARPEVSVPGAYTLTVMRPDSLCFSQDQVNVGTQPCTDIFLPNAITPNGDGINEYFEVKNLPPGTSLTVWHRWGKIAWQSANYQNDWNAEGLPEGVYAVVLRLPDGEVVTGTVVVIR